MSLSAIWNKLNKFTELHERSAATFCCTQLIKVEI